MVQVCWEPAHRRSHATYLRKLRMVAAGLPSTHWASLGLPHHLVAPALPEPLLLDGKDSSPIDATGVQLPLKSSLDPWPFSPDNSNDANTASSTGTNTRTNTRSTSNDASNCSNTSTRGSSSATTTTNISGSRMRVVSLNVHQWKTAKGRNNVDGLVSLVAAQQPHVVCLQESQGGSRGLLEFRSKLSRALPGGVPHVAQRGDVAVLSVWPIGSQATPGSKGRGSTRVMTVEVLVGSADGSDGGDIGEGCNRFHVSCVHLDYQYEPRRLRQMDSLEAHIATIDAGHVVCGDFNALTRSDYSALDWAAIAEVRKRNRWEQPLGTLMDRMGQRGWRDCWRDCCSSEERGPRSTCRFDTRIDYILTSPGFDSAWQQVSCTHVPTDFTDHALVLAEFAPRDAALSSSDGASKAVSRFSSGVGAKEEVLWQQLVTWQHKLPSRQVEALERAVRPEFRGVL